MTQILLIDSSIQDYEEVVKSVNHNTIPILYNKNYTFSDLSNAMTKKIERIGIFCHDSAVHDTFYSDVSDMIDFIQHHTIKQIDFLACNTLNNPEWVKYYKQLPCIVGATNTYTGNAGDWIMQSTGENIEYVYFEQINYKYLLSTFPEGSTIIAEERTSNSTNTPSYLVRYNNTSTNYLLFFGFISGNGAIYLFDMSKISGTSGNVSRYVFETNVRNPSGIAVYRSPYTVPTTIKSSINGIIPTKEYLVCTLSDSPNIFLLYNAYVRARGVEISDIDMTSGFDAGIGNFSYMTPIETYNNYIYYGVYSPPGIGCMTLTDVANGSLPTMSSNNNKYIQSALSNAKFSGLYPTCIKADNNLLYVIIGQNPFSIYRSNPTVNNTNTYILVFYDSTNFIILNNSNQFNGSPNSNLYFTSSSSPYYGVPSSLVVYDNVLYIGTIYGNSTSNYADLSTGTGTQTIAGQTTGYILKYTNGLLSFYSNFYSVGGMCLSGNSLLVSNSIMTLTNGTRVIIYSIPTISGTSIFGQELSRTGFYRRDSGINFDLFGFLKTPQIASDLQTLNITSNYYNNNNLFDLSYNNSAVTYYGVNTGFYIINGNYTWDISTFFNVHFPTLSQNGTINISTVSVPPGLTAGAIPTALVCSSPTKFSYTFTATGSSYNLPNLPFENYAGIYMIIGSGKYYLIINGILSPLYDSTTTIQTDKFIYINGTNYIEIFTYGNIIASFYLKNPNVITINGQSTKYIYTSSSWTKTPIDNAGYVNTANDGTTTTGSFGITSGGLNTKIYDVAVKFNYDANTRASENMAYYFSATSIVNRILNIKAIPTPYNNTFLNFTTTNAKWGFKSVGYFLPNVTGTWIFKICADNFAQFCIGSNNGIPMSINPNVGSVNAAGMTPQCLSKTGSPSIVSYPYTTITNIPSTGEWQFKYITDASYGGSYRDSYRVSNELSVTLSANRYYPVLIYYGSNSGNKFQLTFTNPNNVVYAYDSTNYNSFFYYTNIYPTQ